MTKVTIFICIFLSLISRANSQVSNLLTLKERTEARIQVGMTPDEVKRVLGRPKAIEGGFPKTDQTIVHDFPEQVGQINNSTWFYFLSIVTIKVDSPKVTGYFIHGSQVPEDVFDSYVGVDTVYFYRGKVVHPDTGRNYLQLEDSNLKLVAKDLEKVSVRDLPTKKVPRSFIPIFAVIFDRGTQVVASTKVFFKPTP